MSYAHPVMTYRWKHSQIPHSSSKDTIFNGRENLIFADRSHVISKKFKAFEEKTDSKFVSYRNKLQELAREPVTRENLDISDLPRGSARVVGCTEQPRPTVVRTAGVGKGYFQTLKDSLNRLKLLLSLSYMNHVKGSKGRIKQFIMF